MRTYHCFDDVDLEPGLHLSLGGFEWNHLVKVLRIKKGDRVRVLNGRGTEAEAVYLGEAVGKVPLRVEHILRHETDRPRSPQLALALTRTDAFEDAFERAIELGAAALRPIQAERGVVKLDAKKAARRRDRWQRLAIERLKQCERLWLPEVHEPQPLAALIKNLQEKEIVPVALVEREDSASPLPALLSSVQPHPFCFLVGPEGGWSPAERAVLNQNPAVQKAWLGNAILRAETAALAALATALAHNPSKRHHGQ